MSPAAMAAQGLSATRTAARPPTWVAVVVCVVAILAMTALRLVVFPHKVVPIAYGVPLILFVWLRNRPLLWFSVVAFTCISLVKFFFTLPLSGPEAVGP